MKQMIPLINSDDIKRIIKRDYPNYEFSEIEGMLNSYHSESEQGRNRVYASILKLSNGDIKLLEKYVQLACDDFRDIIALSEYPNYSKFVFDDNLSDHKKKNLIEKDWNQYQYWLRK